MFHRMDRRTTERTAASIRAELARRQISYSQLGRELGWKRSTTWRRVTGAQPFDVDELAAVASYLGLPVSSLIDGDQAA